MNTPFDYRHHGHQSTAPIGSRSEQVEISQLAHHADPSLRTARTAAPNPNGPGFAWVRPTDLAAYAGPMLGRGINLQAELIRRARRTPTTTSRAVRRGINSSSPSTTRPSAPQEGLQL